jgi:hypothetical protein
VSDLLRHIPQQRCIAGIENSRGARKLWQGGYDFFLCDPGAAGHFTTLQNIILRASIFEA